jgi:hypothetical protein
VPACNRELRAVGKRPTTYNVAAEVYQIKPDRHGNRMINDAQHVATKRALGTLRRKGLVSGQQKAKINEHGQKIFPLAVSPTDGRAERCCFWSLTNAPR